MDSMDNSKYSEQHFRVTGISTSVDEFRIRQTTYKISIKLELESGPLNFTSVYTRNTGKPIPIYCTRRSVNLPFRGPKVNALNEVPPYYAFHFELERDIKKQKMETCTLFLKRTPGTSATKENSTMIKYAAVVNCPCTDKDDGQDVKLLNHVTDVYPDCNKADLIDFNQRSCIMLGKHTHDCQSHGLAQEYLITITEFNFSEATMIPYEAQRILAKRMFEKEVRGTHGAYFDEIRKPFDVTIICKDGYEIDVHAYVLATRNPVFRKMLSTNTKISGRGSSFKKLAKAITGKSDRNKSKTATIDESEITSVAMEVILHFIYFGELHNNWRVDLMGVLHGARKYGLKQLLEFINVLLITMCRRKNALALLKIAERYSLKGAETSIRDFVFTNLGGVLQASVKITSV